MMKKSTAAALCGLTAASLFVTMGAPAAGQTAAASPPQQLSGPLVPGVCVLSQEDLIGRSKIGAAASTRLHSLAVQAQAGLDADKASLDRRASALNAERATLTPAQLQAKAQALNQRAQVIQAEAGQRNQQLDATRQKVFALIIQEAQPYIAKAFAAHGCGLLFSRDAVLGGNMANDITPEVLTALDAGGAPLSFDLEPPATPAAR